MSISLFTEIWDWQFVQPKSGCEQANESKEGFTGFTVQSQPRNYIKSLLANLVSTNFAAFLWFLTSTFFLSATHKKCNCQPFCILVLFILPLSLRDIIMSTRPICNFTHLTMKTSDIKAERCFHDSCYHHQVWSTWQNFLSIYLVIIIYITKIMQKC